MKREQFLKGAGGLAAGLAAEALAGPVTDQDVAGVVAEAGELARAAEATEVGATTVSLLEARLERLAAGFQVTPLEAQFLALSAYRRQLAHLLTQRRHRIAEGRDLALLAAKANAMQAQVVLNLGRPDAALELARLALPHAADAGHPDATVWAHKARSVTLYWQGRYQAALDAADAGLVHGRDRSAATADLHAHRARAAAAAGRPDLARQALRDAERTFSTLPSGLASNGFFSTHEAGQAYLASGAFLRIGELRAAREAAERAIALYATPGEGAGSPANQAIATLTIAHTHCLEGAPDQAAALAGGALERFLAQPRRSQQVAQAAGELAGRLAPYRQLPEVRGFQERLAALQR